MGRKYEPYYNPESNIMNSQKMNTFLINHTVYCEYNSSKMNVLTTVHAYFNILHNGCKSKNTIRTCESINN